MAGAGTSVDVGVAVHALGPVRATREGTELPLGGPRQRRLLAVLLIHRGTVVSVDRVAEAVFAGEPTEAAAITLRSYVARLRRVLGEAAVLTRAPGYQLVLPTEAIDVAAFEDGVAAARSALVRHEPKLAVERVRRALDLWQGEPLAEFADEEWAYPEAQRLAELRLTARELLAEASLAAGRTDEVLASLEALRHEHPLREGVRTLLMTAYYRAGRQADALAEMRAFREELAEELGIDPSPGLVELEARILAQDPTLLVAADSAPLRGYLLGQRLGTGREGTVHAATLPGVERDFVVKTLHRSLADDPDFIRAFETSAHRVAALRHPAVLRIHDFWREPGAAYVVLPRVAGGSLRERLRRGPLTRDELRALVERIGGALLATAAGGLVHGRVTPENVLYDGPDPVLTDFWLGGPPPETDDAEAFAALVREAGGPTVAATELGDLVVGLLEELGESPLPEARPNPYQGLRAFDEADEAFYFGRTGLVDDVLGRLAGGDRLVLLVGASGTGKSSAVRAGLLPRLRAGAAGGSDRWFVATMLPGGTPYAELAEALTSIAVVPTDRLDERMGRSDEGIHAALAEVVPEDGELLLVVDQFEELFTMARDQEQRQFLAALTHALTVEGSRLRVVATLRADYYDRPLGVQPFGSFVQAATVTIPAMLPAEIEAAILEPARRVGRTVESGLAAELVGTVATEPAALPALQFVLYELAERGTLTLAAYQKLGGLAGAIAARAEELYQSLDDTDRRSVRELFERLVVVTEGEPTRRRATRDELGAVDAIVDRWARARLLTLDVHPQTRVPTVEVAHEALVREWPRLQGWIEADRGDLVVLARLRDAARAWDDLARDPEALLRGSALEAALEVVEARAVLPVLEAEFVEASRREDELQRARQVVEIRRQVRTNRRLRVQLAGITVMLVLALIGGFIALDQRGEANVARHNAVARELAAAAAANLTDDPERSILLALAAIDATRRYDEPVLQEATDALHRAVSTNRVVRTLTVEDSILMLSRDGRFVIAGAPDAHEIRNAATGKDVRAWTGDAVHANRLGLNPDGRLAATTDEDTLRVWEVATGRLVSERLEVIDRDSAPAFSPDGKFVATTSGHLAVYPLGGGPAVLEVVEDDFEVIDPAVFSPDSRHLVALSNTDAETGVVYSYDLREGRREFTIDLGQVRALDVAWSPDNRWIAVSSSTGQVVLIDPRTRKVGLRASAGTGAINTVAFSRDSRLLATGSDDGSVRVFRVGEGSLEEVHRFAAQGLVSGVDTVAFNRDGTELLALDNAQTAVKTWALGEAAAAEVLNVPTQRPGAFDSPGADFTPDGTSLLVLRGDSQSALHDLRTGRVERVLSTPGLTPVRTDLLLSPDGENLVTRMLGRLDERNFTVRDTLTGAARFRVDTEGRPTDVGAWSSDGEHVAVRWFGQDGGRVDIVDRGGRQVADLGPVLHEVPRLGFADRDRFIVYTTVDEGIQVWDWQQNRLVRSIEADAWLLGVSAHELIVTAPGYGPTAQVWNVRTGKQVAALTGHSGTIRALEWDPAGDRVATASEDGVVRVFDARTGQQLHSLAAPGRAAARGLSFSPDGKRLVVNHSDGIARVWTLDLAELVAIAKDRVTRSLTDIECQDYLHVAKCPRG